MSRDRIKQFTTTKIYIIFKQQMQFSKKQSIVQDLDQHIKENSDSQEFHPHEDLPGKPCAGADDKTQVVTTIMSGIWRTNLMLENEPQRPSIRCLPLKHVTSFEQNSMEIHGKKLKQSYEAYAKSTDKEVPAETLAYQLKKGNIVDWEDIEEIVSQIQDLEIKQINSLLEFSKKRTEAQLLLKELFIRIPKKFLSKGIIIMQELFQDYVNNEIQKLDEDEVSTYAFLNSPSTAKKILVQIQQSMSSALSLVEQEQIGKLVKVWMEAVFLSLNGVYEPIPQRLFEDDTEDGSIICGAPRKMAKLA